MVGWSIDSKDFKESQGGIHTAKTEIDSHNDMKKLKERLIYTDRNIYTDR